MLVGKISELNNKNKIFKILTESKEYISLYEHLSEDVNENDIVSFIVTKLFINNEIIEFADYVRKMKKEH